MIWNIDSIIFVLFLVVNIVLGLASSRGIKNIKEYAIGDRNFSTATLVATIVATWVSGEFFFTIVQESYRTGLNFIWVVVLGNFFGVFLIGYFFAPRMEEFLGNLSIAEAMGDLFGKRIRIITALAGFIGVAGIISIQLKIAGLIFNYALDIPDAYGIILGGLLITLYSSLGGVKSVTFTDVIQFLTFGAVMPAVSYFLLESINDSGSIVHFISTDPLFDIYKVFNFFQPEQLTYLFLFLWFIVPDFNPAYFQRVSMAKDVRQVRVSYIIACITGIVLMILVCWIGVLMKIRIPDINSNDVVKYILSLPVIGIKGLLLTGLIAMIMSTVDSYINSTAVLIVHDFCNPLSNFIKKELFATRIASAILGIVSVIFSLKEGNFLDLMVFSYSFWMPVVTVPFIMAICGFRSSEKSVLLGMTAGISTVFIWDYLVKITIINSIPIAMLANLIILMGSHYLLKQPGGWVGIKNPKPLLAIRKEREERWNGFLRQLKNFDFITACNKNCPKGDGLVVLLGFFVMFSVFISTHTLDHNVQVEYSYFLDFLTPFMFCSTSIIISYPLWLPKWREGNVLGIMWNLIMIIDLICCSFLMVLLSGLSHLQLLAFFANIIMISALVSWWWGLAAIIFGVSITTIIYQNYLALDIVSYNFISSQFAIFYLLLLISSVIVIFLKPKQEHEQKIESHNKYLGAQTRDKEKELMQSLSLKYEFLRNLEHEGHTPITSITNMGLLLYERYDNLSAAEKKDIAYTIAKSSDRLLRLVNNLTDVSKLSCMTYELNKININLSDLVYERIDECKKLYLENKDIDFITTIQDDLIVNCDQHYITSTLDNLIINSIQYSTQGVIRLKLSKINDIVEFSIRDEGVGIPESELYDIFGEFVISSRTKTPARGRGIGLAICKKAIESHGGKIWAKSNSMKGAEFTFTLPL